MSYSSVSSVVSATLKTPNPCCVAVLPVVPKVATSDVSVVSVSVNVALLPNAEPDTVTGVQPSIIVSKVDVLPDKSSTAPLFLCNHKNKWSNSSTLVFLKKSLLNCKSKSVSICSIILLTRIAYFNSFHFTP